MTAKGNFSTTQNVYWPSEYADLVNLMKGLDHHGKPSHDPMYRLNTGPVVFAAAVGLAHSRMREVGPNRQEISTETFETQRLGNSQTSLSSLILLISLIGTQDLELLRPDRETELIRTFERYAAGGFEYLQGALSTSTDVTGQNVVRAEIRRALDAVSDQI